VREYADVLVASEANVPGRGFPYDQVLPLFADASKSSADIGRGIVDAFAESYEAIHHPATTISAFDLVRVDAVAHALDAVGAACLPTVDTQWPAIARALYYGEAYEPRTERESASVFGSRDLLDVLHRMRDGITPFPASKELATLESEVGRFVLATRVGDARRLSHGVSIYAPYRGDQWMPMHETTPLGGNSRWTELVRRAHANAAKHAKEPVLFGDVKVHGHGGKEGAPVRPFDGNALTFTTAGRSIVAIEQWDCARDGPGVAVHDPCSDDERRGRRIRLAAIVEAAQAAVPEIRLTDDMGGRRADVTWDVGESVRVPDDRVAILQRVIVEHGAWTSRSSVHVHATFDADDKASGAVRFVAQRFGEDEGEARVRWAFVGDSGNDRPCFAAFTTTFGVQNVREHAAALSVLPRWVAPSPMGRGFAEIARAILASRRNG